MRNPLRKKSRNSSRSDHMPQDSSTAKKFTGASEYILDEELAKIVNISMALEMPLLLKGEPGTGKTMLAHAISEALNMRLIVLNVKSSMKLVDALYQYDTLTRLNDSRFGDSSRTSAISKTTSRWAGSASRLCRTNGWSC
jgi:MoxR-like ATPase